MIDRFECYIRHQRYIRQVKRHDIQRVTTCSSATLRRVPFHAAMVLEQLSKETIFLCNLQMDKMAPQDEMTESVRTLIRRRFMGTVDRIFHDAVRRCSSLVGYVMVPGSTVPHQECS